MKCRICGETSDDVTIGMLRWKKGGDDDDPEVKYSSAPRCRDRAACYRRVESQGKPWPVIDAGALTLR